MRSQIWKVFNENGTHAKCKICDALVKRGKTPKDYSTKPLINHVMHNHPTYYKKYKKDTEQVSELNAHILNSVNDSHVIIIISNPLYTKLYFKTPNLKDKKRSQIAENLAL